MSNYNRLFYHFVWTTKNRESLITEEIEKTLERCILTKIQKLNSICHQIGMTQDHIHLAASVSPVISLSYFVKSIKGNSAHLINNSFLNQYFSWQNGYGVISFDEKKLPIIKKYIANQKQHHRNTNLINTLEKTASQ